MQPLTSAGVAIAAILAASGLCRADSAGDRSLFQQLDADGDGVVAAAEIPDVNRRLFDRLIRRSDADGDGALSLEEFNGGLAPDTPEKPIEEAQRTELRGADATRLLLLKLDTNGDTRLTRSEAPSELRRAFDQLVGAIDRNKDGELDRQELARGGPQLSRRAEQITRRLGIDVDRELARLEREQGARMDRFDRQGNPREVLANPKQAAELYKQLDADRDGRLVEAELPDQIKEQLGPLLRRADTNRDGGVSKREFLTAAERIASFLGARRPASSNGPSALSSEMSMSSEAGRSNDMQSGAPTSASDALAEKLVRKMVNRLDRDGDGVVARGEARGRMAQRFDQADANGDGKLDAAELRAVAAQLSSRLKNADRNAASRSE